MQYEVNTLDGTCHINDLFIFSKYEDSHLWYLLNEKGIGEFENFVENNLTTFALQTIIHFYIFDKWLYDIWIKRVHNPYQFLNLPAPYVDSCDDTFGYSDSDS
jgi:hypothetical protein